MDHRTAAVVYITQTMVSPITTTLTISIKEAISSTQEAVGTPTTVEVAVSEGMEPAHLDSKPQPGGDSRTSDLIRVIIDGHIGGSHTSGGDLMPGTD